MIYLNPWYSMILIDIMSCICIMNISIYHVSTRDMIQDDDTSLTTIMSRIMSTPISSCDTHDIWTWYRSGMTWDMRWRSTILTFTFISWYHYISISIMWYHVISCDIMWYHVTFSIILYQQYHVVSCDIMRYHVISSVWGLMWGSPTSAWEVL